MFRLPVYLFLTLLLSGVLFLATGCVEESFEERLSIDEEEDLPGEMTGTDEEEAAAREDEEEEEEEKEGPEEALKAFVAAVRSLDLEGAGEYVARAYEEEFAEEFAEMSAALEGEEEEDEIMLEIYTLLLERLEVDVIGHRVNGEEALVSTFATVPDIAHVTELLMEKQQAVVESEDYDFEEMSEEEVKALGFRVVREALEESDLVTNAVPVVMVREDGRWKVMESAIFGYAAEF